MLDIDEQRLEVRCLADTGDFAANWPDQEAFDLAAFRVGYEHLVVAERAVAELAAAHVGLNPQPPFIVEPQAIRAGEDVAVVQGSAARVAAVVLGAAEQEDIPGKAVAGEILAGFAPTNDMPVGVWAARVGGVAGGAAAVVGQGEVDVASVRVDRTPFRAVHLGRA